MFFLRPNNKKQIELPRHFKYGRNKEKYNPNGNELGYNVAPGKENWHQQQQQQQQKITHIYVFVYDFHDINKKM